ncbi:protein phosphatase 1 regulatory subunit 21 isoform X1 [Sitophilus oryzae]|uniref:Protein phosphatase 1 regulatory subunit 21 isoform X1 n=1 Tax=Sitophilus oryzae TaxID=7048 RepID=A0A6J2X1F3_SITOR|nr:protein phosphatase 1 regulatory subunit 21 isoform X1 [Sitophilus oryzae]
MDKQQTEIESKYQKLAAEYSKVRSQATVLKKAVLDEQAKNSQLTEIIRNGEQTIRKRDQEMESLTFRNEQLTKRISVLQQELQISSRSKKGKQKNVDTTQVHDFSVLDEEFQKKILENANLLSSISDKDLEITSFKEKIIWLEEKLLSLQKELTSSDDRHKDKLEKLQKDKETLVEKIKEFIKQQDCKENDDYNFWKSEAEKWKSECELLRCKPNTNERLSEYYESQLRDTLESKAVVFAETKSLFAENQALKSRLENFISEHTELQKKLEISYEELVTTNENYKSQLDAMTEHFATQNEKITQQCDEIQILKHKLASKK